MNNIVFGRSPQHRAKKSDENADEVRVIGAGLPRTGTSSLKAALELLGFGPCHHMSEVFGKIEQAKMFDKILNGEPADFKHVLKGYGATVDDPTSSMYKEVHKTFPRAKIILTVRDSDEAWYKSYRSTVGSAANDRFFTFATLPFSNLRSAIRVANRIQHKRIAEYGSMSPSMHKLHNQKVIDENPTDNLLVYNVKQGWAPLCEFLEVPIPDIPFPHVNDAAYFQSNIRRAKAMGLFVWALIGVVLGASGYYIRSRIQF